MIESRVLDATQKRKIAYEPSKKGGYFNIRTRAEKHHYTIEDSANDEKFDVEIEVYYQRYGSCASWLGMVHVCCKYEGESIGNAQGLLVDREQIRSRFEKEMFSVGGVLRDIATWILDRYGRLNREHQPSRRHEDWAPWGDLLDDGAIFVIQLVYVYPGWRKHGLATEMMKILERFAYKRSALSMFAVPRWLPWKEHKELLEGHVHSGSQYDYLSPGYIFWRMGFRPIGDSPCFALHIGNRKPLGPLPSANLGDYKTICGCEQKWHHREANKIEWPFGSWDDQEAYFEREKSNLPILYATMMLDDRDLAERYEELIEDHNSEAWLKTDRSGRNVLHLAALLIKPLSLNWLFRRLDNSICFQLSKGRTLRGYRPLEELQLRLERARITDGISATSETFKGFNDEIVHCLLQLKVLELIDHDHDEVVDGLLRLKAPEVMTHDGQYPWTLSCFLKHEPRGAGYGMLEGNEAKFGIEIRWRNGEDLGDLLDDVESVDPKPWCLFQLPRAITRDMLKWGCTCEVCLGGAVPRRMKFVLLVQLKYLINNLEKGCGTKQFWKDMKTFWTQCLPLRTAQWYRSSWTRQRRDLKIFKVIQDLLDSEILPGVSSIRSKVGGKTGIKRWDENWADFTNDIKTALRLLFEFAKDQDKFAGTHRFGEPLDCYEDVLNKFDPCRNDHEYEPAARRCDAAMDLPFDSSGCVTDRRQAIS